MASRKPVNAATVRAWGAANLSLVPEVAHVSILGSGPLGPRGKIHPEGIAAFHKNNKGLRYEQAGVAQRAQTTVSFDALDALGRRITRKATLTNAAARVVLNQPTDRHGRIAKRDLALALSAMTLAGLDLPTV